MNIDNTQPNRIFLIIETCSMSQHKVLRTGDLFFSMSLETCVPYFSNGSFVSRHVVGFQNETPLKNIHFLNYCSHCSSIDKKRAVARVNK